MPEFRLRFYWSLFLRFQLTILQHSGLTPDILKMESWTHMGRTANIIIKDIIHIFASICKNLHILLMGRHYRERWHWFRHWTAPSHHLNQWWLVYWRIYPSPGLNELINWVFFFLKCNSTFLLLFMIDVSFLHGISPIKLIVAIVVSTHSCVSSCLWINSCPNVTEECVFIQNGALIFSSFKIK